MIKKIEQIAIADDSLGSLAENGIQFTFRAKAEPDIPILPDKVLFIPMNVMIVDLYERGVLTPIDQNS